MPFAKYRLEGRALELELKGDTGYGISMQKPDGTWMWVQGAEARQIRLCLRARVKELKPDMEAHGLICGGALELAAHGGKLHSIDLKVRCRARGEEALVQVKWTRQDQSVQMAKGREDLPHLEEICENGRWERNRHEITASLVGVLVVGPDAWQCELKSCNGSWSASYSSIDEAPEPPSRSGARTPGRSNWAPWRGDAPPGSALWPSGGPGSSGSRAPARKRPASAL